MKIMSTKLQQTKNKQFNTEILPENYTVLHTPNKKIHLHSYQADIPNINIKMC